MLEWKNRPDQEATSVFSSFAVAIHPGQKKGKKLSDKEYEAHKGFWNAVLRHCPLRARWPSLLEMLWDQGADDDGEDERDIETGYRILCSLDPGHGPYYDEKGQRAESARLA